MPFLLRNSCQEVKNSYTNDSDSSKNADDRPTLTFKNIEYLKENFNCLVIPILGRLTDCYSNEFLWKTVAQWFIH